MTSDSIWQRSNKTGTWRNIQPENLFLCIWLQDASTLKTITWFLSNPHGQGPWETDWLLPEAGLQLEVALCNVSLILNSLPWALDLLVPLFIKQVTRSCQPGILIAARSSSHCSVTASRNLTWMYEDKWSPAPIQQESLTSNLKIIHYSCPLSLMWTGCGLPYIACP